MGKAQSMRQSLQRLSAALTGVVFVAMLATQILPGSASATGQVTARKILMSTSAPSAQATYALTFTPATTYTTTAASLAIDFCSDTPLPGQTCAFSAATVPTVAAGVTVAVSSGTVTSPATVLGSGTPLHTLGVTNISAGFTSGTPITITFNATPASTLTNPTGASPGSFYARVVTYNSATGATTGGATGYVPANSTGGATTIGSGALDTGGIALAVTSNITITSKVYETLTFCVYTGSCGTAPNLTLGSATTGALDPSNAYVNSATAYQIATNAGTGVNVTMTGTTLCRSATPANCNTGTATINTITSIGTTAGFTTPATSSVGTEQFGMCAWKNGSAALTVAAPYNDTINSCTGAPLATGIYTGSSVFGFDDTTGAGGTNNAAGSQVMSSSGAVAPVTGSFSFLGNIAPATEPGIYTTNLNMVATGTF